MRPVNLRVNSSSRALLISLLTASTPRAAIRCNAIGMAQGRTLWLCAAASVATACTPSKPPGPPRIVSCSPTHSPTRPSSLRSHYGPPRVVDERDSLIPEGLLAEDARVCDLVSISWIDSEGNVAWTRPVAAHMTDSYVCVPENSVCDPRVADDTAPSTFTGPLSIFPPLVTQKWIAIGDRTGLVVLDLASGRVLLDWGDPAARRTPSFVANTAHYRVEGLSCEGEARSGRPLVVCGDNLLYFSGRVAVLVDVHSWTVVANGRFAKQTDDDRRVTTRVSLGKWTLALDGRMLRIH
jgi:hypothetical protein